MSGFILFFLDSVNLLVFAYFVALNGVYLVVTFVAFRALAQHARRMQVHSPHDVRWVRAAPPVTMIVPLYNEVDGAVQTARALLAQEYPRFEIILVDDGSEDGTGEALIDEFGFEPSARVQTADLPCVPVEAVWHTPRHPQLTLLTKAKSGKPDAQNAALNYCQTPLFCVVDGDTLVEREGLLRLSRPFLEDRTNIATGGVLRILNDCVTDAGFLEEVRFPRSLLARFQVLEYIRGFLVGRIGWAKLDMLLIISGAFGMFRREAVVRAGGFSHESIGEDMELVVRLHMLHRREKIPYRVSFVPDPVAWTTVPETISMLFRQRSRWHRGLIQSLQLHGEAFFNPRYGRIGLGAFVHYGVLERWGPIVEVVGYVAFLVAALLGRLSLAFALAFLALAIGFGALLSLLALLMEELTFRRYDSWRDLGRLLLVALLENFGYRQMVAFMRASGSIAELRGIKDRW